jgi:FAD/FMN-containing dehydrogenase/Fe-S oxidoreductase
VSAAPQPSASAIKPLESALRSRIDGDVSFDAGARALYATDASNYRQVPVGVVVPRTAEDVVETVRTCREHQVPILPRGGGTSLAGQCCNAAVVIDMSQHLNGVVAIDHDRRTARVQPGLVLDALQRATAGAGLMFGPDPATHAWCTLGGMIGNNSCGVHSVMAGLTADNVEALEVLTSDGSRFRVGRTSHAEAAAIAREGGRRGEIYTSLAALGDRYRDEIRARFPRIPRRVSGYNLDALVSDGNFDLARALVGSEGTCVTILEATVRLVDAPIARALLVLGYPDVYAPADRVLDMLAAKPIGLETIDSVIVDGLKAKAKLRREVALLPEGAAWMLIEFGGRSTAEASSAAEDLRRQLLRSSPAPDGRVFTDPAEMRMVWHVRESGLGATAFVPGESATWEGWEDAAVPPERLGQYLRDFRRLLDRYRYRGALYGHFGQGCVHTRTNFDLESASGIAKFRAFLDDAADLVVRYGGSLSGEHGDGQARAALLPKMFGDRLVGAFREFKRIWDPDGLMNPGKVVDAFSPTDNLRRPGYQPPSMVTFFPLRAEGGIGGAALRCVGVGKCRKHDEGAMCPSFMATRQEQHSTRGRAHLLFEMLRGETITSGWDSHEVKAALDLCLACKACKSECPVGVDMATYKAEFLAQHYLRRRYPMHAHLFGHIDWWASVAARAPRVANGLAAMASRARLLSAVGIAHERPLPRFATETFQQWWGRRPVRDQGTNVTLWSDTFTNYFYPEVGRAAVHVLEKLGYRVTVPPQACCGRPLYDFGLLDSALDHLEGLFALPALIQDDAPIVVLEPSCFSVFRDEALNLFPDEPIARSLSDRAVLFETFLRPHFERGALPALAGAALVHLHCHQQALSGHDAAAGAFSVSGLDAEVLDAGCCGMAGSFGFNKQHYKVSIDIGERALLPAVRGASPDTAIIVNGFSCREQIRHLAGRSARHFAEIVHQSMEGA